MTANARILDGRALANKVAADIAVRVEAFRQRAGTTPRLEVVLVGDDPASGVYVRNKSRACEKAGMRGSIQRLPADTSEARLLDVIDALNADPDVHGVLVQLPLPPSIRSEAVIERIDPRKDVDGFHPENLGRLALGRPRFVPCTPLGVQRLLVAEGVPIPGARVAVLGRSRIVGKPMALLLMEKGADANATVTVAHTGTRDLPAVAREADILVVAMGQPEAVTADWVKPGAVVVDVGIHKRPAPDGSGSGSGSLVGDVHAPSVAAVASALTPVPGGVGPMTVAMLLENTLRAAEALVPSAAYPPTRPNPNANANANPTPERP